MFWLKLVHWVLLKVVYVDLRDICTCAGVSELCTPTKWKKLFGWSNWLNYMNNKWLWMGCVNQFFWSKLQMSIFSLMLLFDLLFFYITAEFKKYKLFNTSKKLLSGHIFNKNCWKILRVMIFFRVDYIAVLWNFCLLWSKAIWVKNCLQLWVILNKIFNQCHHIGQNIECRRKAFYENQHLNFNLWPFRE